MTSATRARSASLGNIGDSGRPAPIRSPSIRPPLKITYKSNASAPGCALCNSHLAAGGIEEQVNYIAETILHLPSNTPYRMIINKERVTVTVPAAADDSIPAATFDLKCEENIWKQQGLSTTYTALSDQARMKTSITTIIDKTKRAWEQCQVHASHNPDDAQRVRELEQQLAETQAQERRAVEALRTPSPRDDPLLREAAELNAEVARTLS